MTAEMLRASYRAFAEVVTSLGEDDSWRPTGCTGWSVRDLVFHCLTDAQRGLVALHTTADGVPDTDAVSYWQDWKPDRPGATNARRWVRVSASMFPEFGQLRDLYLETAAATTTAAGEIEPDRPVITQGHLLAASDLLTTLAVEATVHHLDLVIDLPAAPPPAPAGLAAVRTTLDGLLGYAVPLDWSDEHYALAGTGRTPLTDAERDILGKEDAGRFPLFG